MDLKKKLKFLILGCLTLILMLFASKFNEDISNLLNSSGDNLNIIAHKSYYHVYHLSRFLQSNLRASNTPISQQSVDDQIEKIRKMKQSGVIIETDPVAQSEIAALQSMLLLYVVQKYGPEPYYIEMKVRFPPSMLDAETSSDQKILILLAPLKLVPYSVYYILDIVDNWKGGAFHRNAGHVLQAMVNKFKPGLAFQEYHPSYPHKKFTLGYAGRPGGPEFYISTVDNTKNHGPASQGSKTEADSCFGRIISGFDVVEKMKKQPGAGPNGFINSPEDYIRIPSITLKK